jgi:DNA-binding NtrC family response regulator
MLGMEALSEIRAGNPDPPVLALSVDGSVARAVAATRAWTRDYVINPVALRRLPTAARRRIEVSSLGVEVRRLYGKRPSAGELDDLVAESAAIRASIDQARKSAKSLIPALIAGESGGGGEVFTGAVDAESPQVDAPFVAAIRGTTPIDLIESILFGSVRPREGRLHYRPRSARGGRERSAQSRGACVFRQVGLPPGSGR